MSYTSTSKLDDPIHKQERNMLLAGFSYAEIADALGSRHKSISERNRLVYRVDIQSAFAKRIERDGIPCRLAVAESFGSWFSGFFDGEGHIGIYSRVRANGYAERRLSIQIMVRDDDADTLTFIKDNLGVGIFYNSKGHGDTNPTACFRVEQIKDLAEVIVPLFDRYPLHTKKAREFAIWRTAVRTQYILTLGGYSQRVSATDEQSAVFDKALQDISKVRRYAGHVVE